MQAKPDVVLDSWLNSGGAAITVVVQQDDPSFPMAHLIIFYFPRVSRPLSERTATVYKASAALYLEYCVGWYKDKYGTNQVDLSKLSICVYKRLEKEPIQPRGVRAVVVLRCDAFGIRIPRSGGIVQPETCIDLNTGYAYETAKVQIFLLPSQ